MNKIKDFFNVTLFKNKKPIYDEDKYYHIGDKGILLKIILTYDYGLDDLFGKTFQIQYLLPNNGLYIDDFLIDTHGMFIERRINDKCFNNEGDVFIKFAIKDINDDTYIQMPYTISFKVKESFISPKHLTDSVQGIMIEGLIERINLTVEKYIENNLSDIITESCKCIIEDNVMPKVLNKIDSYVEEKLKNINVEPKVITENIVEKYDDKTLYSYVDNKIKNIQNNIKDIKNTPKITYSNSFDVNNNIVYLSDKVIEYNGVKIFSMNEITSDSHLLKENNKVYLKLNNNKYMEFVVDKPNLLDEVDLKRYLIDYRKLKAYNELEEIKQTIINDYMSSYLFGVNTNFNQRALKDWYYKQIEKIKNYNDLSIELSVERM